MKNPAATSDPIAARHCDASAHLSDAHEHQRPGIIGLRNAKAIARTAHTLQAVTS